MYNMETAALVVPVTALEFLQDTFLLTGEGPVLTVFSVKPQTKACTSLSLLQHQRIHGIRPRHEKSVPAQTSATGAQKDDSSSTSKSNLYDLAVFGGKAVRLARLYVNVKDGEHQHLEIVSPLMELKDWALDVQWLCGGDPSLLCVAVAHNSALLLDVTTGNAVVQCSCLEGCLLYSALLLVHQSWEDTVLVGGTVFNQLVLWKPGDKRTTEDKAPIERRLLGHSGVIFSISYLREKGWLASASDDRSVRVWGVGALGGPGGKCGDSNPSCLRVLYGHQARVFSVRLSPGKVFSAGEDGACLVWDWAGGGKVVRTLKGHRAGGVRSLAISEGMRDEARWVATGGADGAVRMWRVEGSEEKTEEGLMEKLTDLKFPGQGLAKVVCTAVEEDTDLSWFHSKFVVCTDQGRVYQYSVGEWEMIWEGPPEFQSYCVMETVDVSVKDSTEKGNLCAVGNLSGSIQVFISSQPQCGVFLTGGPGKIHSLIWQKARGSLYLLASGAEGLVYRWRIEVKLDENCSLVLNASHLPSFLLPPCAKRWLTAALPLSSMSRGLQWVCGDRRGSLLLFREEDTVKQKMEGYKGSKTMTEKDKELTLNPLSCLFGVHGKQGVTSVCEYQGLLYSTGRDGCVRVFRVQQTPPEEKKIEQGGDNKGGLQLEVLRVQRACKGMEWLERILFLEPETTVEEKNNEEHESNCKKDVNLDNSEEERSRGGQERMENKGREARFAIVGFHAVHFVVWDPVRQERLLAVPCGGGHRSWSLWPSNKGVWPGYGALVFIKQGAIMASQPPGEVPSLAGKAERTGGLGLREGVHGRGIGCVCRVGRIRGKGIQDGGGDEEEEMEQDEGHWEIMVTGGEDTSLTILAVHPESGTVKVLSVITDHISSVRTVTVVSEDRSEDPTQSLSVLLVSAGGRAQMQCYRLLIGWDGQRLVPSCQVIQVAGHRLDEKWERRRNRHKTVKMDPETRYMSVVVVDENKDRCLLAVACSDGAIRLFSVSEAKRQIDLLWEMFYHQRCVLSVTTCSLEDANSGRHKLLFSAATDGKIAVWDLTQAGTSGSDAPTPPLPCLVIPAHQSGINSLAVWAEEQKDVDWAVTVASGGDDGQLTVSTIKESRSAVDSSLKAPSSTQSSKQLCLHVHSQFNVPLAHAAPITALMFFSPDLVVSTSSDQRVCLWRVSSASVSHAGALCSHVADAAGLAVWKGQIGRTGEERGEETPDDSEGKTERGPGVKTDERGWVLVCGQGFQLLRLTNTSIR